MDWSQTFPKPASMPCRHCGVPLHGTRVLLNGDAHGVCCYECYLKLYRSGGIFDPNRPGAVRPGRVP
jgi:hypothetical protein